MFEKASRMKLRFNTIAGVISVEELWDIPLTSNNSINLDDIAKDLNRKLKMDEDESFVKKRKVDEKTKLAFDIVKHVISVRLEEKDAAENAIHKRQTKQKIMEIISNKKDENLRNKSIDELEKMLEEA